MNLLLFVATILVSIIIVHIGAVAFNLTGVEWAQAKFQALSCFSGTGFTTREAEIIVGHTQRRRIAGTLMILGNAGLVTLIATFANSIRTDSLTEKFTLPFLHVVFPGYLVPYANFAVIVLAIFLAFKIVTNNQISRKATANVRRYLIARNLVRPSSFEELLVAAGDYGISSMEIADSSSLKGLFLKEACLRQQDITVLAIDRAGQTIANPDGEAKILQGDRLICFGKLENVRRALEHFQPDGSLENNQEGDEQAKTTGFGQT